ncbi:MAG: hypothetical protein IJJ34_06520 [Clostridia bacterium]|nr:hypothetical protein [Clostridia bacterium]
MKRMLRIAALLLCLMLLAMSVLCGCAKATYKITVDAAHKFLVYSCPKRAVPGETVTVEVAVVEDGDIHVAVNGDADFGRFTKLGVYEFIMPEEDVTVHVWATSNGLA